MKPLSSLLALWLLQIVASHAATYVPVGSSSTLWNPIVGNFDYHVDQQTGGTTQPSSSDIVGGTGTNYGFLVAFNDNGNVNSIDGTMGFRVRLDTNGGTDKNPAFNAVAWVGIDADASGSIDVFLGANFQGGNSQLEIRASGGGANISPSTTTIANTAFKTYTLDTIEDATPANYNYRPVNFLTDGGNTDDLTQNTSGDTDFYLSFNIPFADVVQFLGALQNPKTPINITDKTPLRFVVMTATQANALNQDIGGVDDNNFNPGDTWEVIGGLTPPYTPVPEPSNSLLLLGSLTAGCLIRRRR
jgi:hypothetical protein